MTVPAARVLAFPGIDLEALTKLRNRACDAFMSDDLTAYQDACMMMRKLLGGRDVAETGDRSDRDSEKLPGPGLVTQGMREPFSAKRVEL
jgi:ABC-type amino acid transport substrate-binding protein